MRKYLEEQQRTGGKTAPDGELAGKAGSEKTTFIVMNGPTQQRIRELYRDQPLFSAPPPHFVPALPSSVTTNNKTTDATSTSTGTAPLNAPLPVCATSAAKLTTPLRLVYDTVATPSNLKLSGAPKCGDPLLGQPLPQEVAPVAAPSATIPSSNGVLPSPSTVVVQPPPCSDASAAPLVVKRKRGRKPKDPVAHAAKKELQEKRRLIKEALLAAPDEMEGQRKPRQKQQIVFVSEEIQRATISPPLPAAVPVAASIPSSARRTSLSSAKEVVSSRPSTSGVTCHLDPASTTLQLSSFTTVFESKKRAADSAFADDITSGWLANDDQNVDVNSTWTVSTPIESPIVQSPEEQTGGLDIFLQAPPSTPIDEILSSSAQLGINPALLLQEDIISSMNLSKAVRVLKSPLEILDEYPFHQPASPGLASNRPETPMDESVHNKKLGLMDMLLKSNDAEDRPSPKKKPRPDLVFSTTKRGKAIVSLQKNAANPVLSADMVEPPTTPVKEVETGDDLRSLVLKRRQEVWGDEVGTEVTRITVHRRITSRKTSTGLMSPLSPTSTAKRMAANGNSDSTIMESDSDSSDSSDSEDEEEEHISQHSQAPASQVTPLATPTNPLVLSSAQSMQKSFSAPGLFYPQPAIAATENIFLPQTPQEDDNDLTAILNSSIPPSSSIELGRLSSRTFDDTSMRCKTCGMLFRKNSVLTAHERTCMVKQTPFIPYDFLKDHVDDCPGFGFGAGRHSLFTNDDIVLTPRNLAAAFDSPLLLHQGMPGGKEGKKGMGVIAPKDTVSEEDDEDGEGEVVPSPLPRSKGKEFALPVPVEKMVVGQPRGQTRCICDKPGKAVTGVMVQWYTLSPSPFLSINLMPIGAVEIASIGCIRNV